MKNSKDKIVCVTWLDAAGMQKEDKDKIKDMSPSDLLVTTTTYGILWKSDDNAIILLQENSDEQVDYTVIPKSLIIKTEILK